MARWIFPPGVLPNVLSRMSPLRFDQAAAYPYGLKGPPPGLEGLTPTWEVIPLSLAARETQQAKVSLKAEFHLLSIQSRSPQTAGFAMQLYDVFAKRKLMDRGANFQNVTGAGANPLWLREPYKFLPPDFGGHAQAYLIVKNLATVSNAIEVVLYGVSELWHQVGKRPPSMLLQ